MFAQHSGKVYNDTISSPALSDLDDDETQPPPKIGRLGCLGSRAANTDVRLSGDSRSGWGTLPECAEVD